MNKDPLHQILHAAAHSAKHEYMHGNKKLGGGVLLVVSGIFLLPVPIIGLPLILMGIWKLFS